MADAFEISAIIAADAAAIYDAWIDATKHAAMTGAPATSDPRAGGRFTAWDGYIEGTHVELERPSRIVQAWRTAEFPDDASDSHLEVRLAEAEGGTRVTIAHWEIPEGQGAKYEQGW